MHKYEENQGFIAEDRGSLLENQGILSENRGFPRNLDFLRKPKFLKKN